MGTSVSGLNVKRLIMVPALIALAVTIVRLVGEISGGPSSLFNRSVDTKDPIYSFHLDGKAYAVPFTAYEGGAVFRVGERDVFLYRPKGVAVYYSTLAFQAAQGEFVRRANGWYHGPSDARLEPEGQGFAAPDGARASVSRIDGFDTFWYMWSLTNPATKILKPLASTH